MKFLKLLYNPFVYLDKFMNYLQSILLWFFRKILYKKVIFTSYISLKSSIRNHKNISLGKNVQINSFVVLWPTSLQIGNEVQINPGTAIYGKVIIGNNVMIAPNCMIVGGNHGFEMLDQPMIFQKSTEKGIVIEDDVWIGANSVVLDGVVIKKGAVIAAGAVVSKNVEQFELVAGVPAKKIKNRLELHGKS